MRSLTSSEQIGCQKLFNIWDLRRTPLVNNETPKILSTGWVTWTLTSLPKSPRTWPDFFFASILGVTTIKRTSFSISRVANSENASPNAPRSLVNPGSEFKRSQSSRFPKKPKISNTTRNQSLSLSQWIQSQSPSLMSRKSSSLSPNHSRSNYLTQSTCQAAETSVSSKICKSF